MALGKTPVFDWKTGEFKTSNQGAVLVAEDASALEQIIIKAQQTQRNTYLIYADVDNINLDHKYGNDINPILLADLTEDERDSEIKRAIKEALIYDPWINDVSDISLSYEVTEYNRTMVYADFTIYSVFDTTIEVKGATVNG